jgi:beta-phosphoglucomutase-like phosphatase (HAD superfamily)
LTKSCFDKKPEEIFTSIATGNLVKQKKPAADLYNLVLKETALNSKECLAIEDSRIGLMAAKGANIPTLVSPSIYHIDENFSEADYTCVTLEREAAAKKTSTATF